MVLRTEERLGGKCAKAASNTATRVKQICGASGFAGSAFPFGFEQKRSICQGLLSGAAASNAKYGVRVKLMCWARFIKRHG